MLLLLLILAATPAPESYAVDGQSWHDLRSSRPVTTRPASQPATRPAATQPAAARVYSRRVPTSQPVLLRGYDRLPKPPRGSNLERLLNGRRPDYTIGPRGNIVHEPTDLGPPPTKRRR